MSKWVYAFDEVEQAEAHVDSGWEGVRALLGGKGANLAEMTRIDVPVPPGFTITTEACNAYLAAGAEFPAEMWNQVVEALNGIEEKTGKSFGDPSNPLLVSCRSGAKFSMPGMMDTVLNIGLNDEVADGMIKMSGDPRFIYDSYRRLVQMFGSVVLNVDDEPFEEVLAEYREKRGVTVDSELTAEDFKAIVEEFKAIIRRFARLDFPTDPLKQLELAAEAVFRSWNGKRAFDYRNAAGIAFLLP